MHIHNFTLCLLLPWNYQASKIKLCKKRFKLWVVFKFCFILRNWARCIKTQSYKLESKHSNYTLPLHTGHNVIITTWCTKNTNRIRCLVWWSWCYQNLFILNKAKHREFIHLKQHQKELLKEKYTEYSDIAQGW